MTSLRGASRNTNDRDQERIQRLELCEVKDIYPHINPDDPCFNSVDIKLRDVKSLTDPKIGRVRVIPAQNIHGNRFGHPWNPRVGDLVLVAFYANEKGIILATIANQYQKPVCRASPYDEVFKFCKWQQVDVDENLDFINHPEGVDPTCFKWFHGPLWENKGRDLLIVQDCFLGNQNHDCSQCKNIDCVGLNCTWIKILSKDSESTKYPARRLWIHHNCGSTYLMDQNGQVLIKSKSSENSLEDEQNTLSYIHLKEDSTVEIKNKVGAMVQLHASGLITVKNQSGAKITITPSGEININGTQEVNITAPQINIQGHTDISGGGTCDLYNTRCPCPHKG